MDEERSRLTWEGGIEGAGKLAASMRRSPRRSVRLVRLVIVVLVVAIAVASLVRLVAAVVG